MEVRNVSLDELANDSDVNIELVEKILNGEIIPSLTPLTKIARVLGVRIGTFIDDDEVKNWLMDTVLEAHQIVKRMANMHGEII